MKKLLLLLFTINCFAQAPTIEWQKSFGGTNVDGAYGIKQTSDGGYVLGGMTKSNNGDVTGFQGYNDFWVVKLNTSGTMEWQKTLGGTQNDQVFSIDQTSDGGVIVGGVTDSNNGNVTGWHGNSDYWVAKLNSTGNLEWQKAFGGTNNELVNTIKQTSDGGYIIGGYTNSIDGDLAGTGTRTYPDAWLIKLDATGATQWKKVYGGSDYEVIYDIQQTADGGYIVACESASHDGGVVGVHYAADYWIIKLDSSGTIQWQKAYGGNSSDFPESIKVTADGGYIVAGATYSQDGDITNNHGSYDCWIVKLNAAGELEWEKTLGGSGYDWAVSIDLTVDGGYILAAYTTSNDGDVTNNHGGHDYWLVKLSGTGQIQWQKTMGGTGDDDAFSLVRTNDNGFAVAGFANSINGDVTGNHGNNDIWIVKLAPEQLSVLAFDTNNLKIYPNPAEKFINLETSNGIKVDKIILTDLAGKIITIQTQSTNQINIENLSAGVYFIQAFSGENVYKSKFIKE